MLIININSVAALDDVDRCIPRERGHWHAWMDEIQYCGQCSEVAQLFDLLTFFLHIINLV